MGNDTVISAGKTPTAPLASKDVRSKGHRIAAEVFLLLLIIVFCIFPFYWMVTTSLKTQLEALASPPTWIFEPTFANYTQVLFEDKVGLSLINSLIVAVCERSSRVRARTGSLTSILTPPIRSEAFSFWAR